MNFYTQFYPFVQWESIITGYPETDQAYAWIFSDFIDEVAHEFCEITGKNQNELFKYRIKLAELFVTYLQYRNYDKSLNIKESNTFKDIIKDAS
jgi:hypothetical protein